MKGCMIKVLVSTLAVFALVSLGFGIRYRDIPEPDLSEIKIERMEVPDDENAYPFFRRAYEESVLNGDQDILNSDWDEIEDKNKVTGLINRNRKMQEQLEAGLSRDFCLVPNVTTHDSVLPYLSEWMNLQSYLRVLADHQVSENMLSEASDTLVALFRFGDLTSAYPETLLQYTLAMFPKSMAVSRMSQLALHPELMPCSLIKMAEALEEAGPNKEALSRALKAEFSQTTSLIDSINRRPLTLSEFSSIHTLEDEYDFLERIPLPGLLFQPNRTKRIFRDAFVSVIQNLDYPYKEMDHPENTYLMPYSGWRSMLRENGLGDLLYMMLLPAFDSVLRTHVNYEADFAALQLVLALQRYQRDFGVFPDRLNALVPVYLEQLPKNPFNGESFQYDYENKVLRILRMNFEGVPKSIEIPFAHDPGFNSR